MQLSISELGYLQGSDIETLESPFCDARPPCSDIDLLVIHNISLPAGVFHNGYIKKLFTNGLGSDDHESFASLDGVKVSAHLLINRQGEITQFVPFSKRAWHAGVSSYQGRSACNDFSIGIELEGTDTWVYTRAQYRCLIAVTRSLMLHYPKITLSRIVGHQTIAPGRKSDPGPAFDWRYFKDQLSQ